VLTVAEAAYWDVEMDNRYGIVTSAKSPKRSIMLGTQVGAPAQGTGAPSLPRQHGMGETGILSSRAPGRDQLSSFCCKRMFEQAAFLEIFNPFLVVLRRAKLRCMRNMIDSCL
jgi:hypothetical protein